MPEVGGKQLAANFGSMLGDLRKLVDEVKAEVGAAVTELADEVRSGKDVAKAIRAEAAEVRKTFGDVLGNRPPGDPPDPTKPQGGGSA
jgi:hypothetical protein